MTKLWLKFPKYWCIHYALKCTSKTQIRDKYIAYKALSYSVVFINGVYKSSFWTFSVFLQKVKFGGGSIDQHI